MNVNDCFSHELGGDTLNEYIYSNVKKRTKEDYFPLKNSEDLVGGGGDSEEPPYEGFCRLTLIDGSVVEIEGEGKLTYSMITNKSLITKVEIGLLCTSLGPMVFENCGGLISIGISNSVTNIGDFAFFNCTGLISITLSNSVTSIGDCAFSGCSGLTSIVIPSSVTSIGNQAFSGCSGFASSIEVESDNLVYDSRDNCNAIIETASNVLIAGCKNTVIPSSVISIGDSAFIKCEDLISIIIPSNVTTIDGYAFGYTGLTSITIPNSVISIGEEVFAGCNSLSSVSIGSGVTSIDSFVFDHCSNLTSITSLATTAPTIKEDTFQDINTGGTLTVPAGSTGYNTWMGTGNYYLGKYGWTLVEQ